MNSQEYYLADDEFRVGLYSYSTRSGLQFVSSIMSTNLQATHVIPATLRKMIAAPDAYFKDQEVLIWMNEPL